jgi:hypothetical protein
MNFLKPITVIVHYDTSLQKITGVKSEKVIVSENCAFIFLLQSIFSSHPQIPAQYPAGTLGLLLNNNPPRELDIIEEEDQIMLTASIVYPHSVS